MGWTNSGWRSDDGGWYKNATAAAFALTYQSGASAGIVASGATLSFGNLPVIANTRLIVMTQYWGNGATDNAIASVSVGGSSAFSLVSGTNASADTLNTNYASSEIWMSTGSVTVNPSAAVSVTLNSATSWQCAVALFALTTTTPTPNDGKNGTQNFGTSVATATALSVPVGGGGLVCYSNNNNATTTGQTNWATDVTVTSPSGQLFLFGHTTATGSITPDASWTGNTGANLSAASWSA